MVIRAKIFSRWFLRPWLGIPVGIWIAVVTLVYYSWIYSISTTDHHMPPPVFKTPDKLAELQTLSPMWSNYQVPVVSLLLQNILDKFIDSNNELICAWLFKVYIRQFLGH